MAKFRRTAPDLQAVLAAQRPISDTGVTVLCAVVLSVCALLGPSASPGFAEPVAAPGPVAPPVPPATAQPAPVAIARTSRELAHFKAFDAAIADVLATEISAEQGGLVKAAIKAIADTDPEKALQIRDGIKHPVGLKLVNWYRLRAGYGQLAEYQAFLADNPAWPDRGTLNQRYEELVFAEGGSAPAIKQRFSENGPRTAMGHAALASAELALGDVERAKARAVRIWREMNVPANYEVPFLDRFGGMLSQADHQWRLDRLIVDDVRFAAERTDRIATIRRQIYRLTDEAARKRGEARLLVFNKAKIEDARFEMQRALPSAPKTDYGFLYHRIQLLRRQDKDDDAIRLLQQAPTDPALTPNLDDWWQERRILAYAALENGDAKLAYSLVKAPGPLSVNPAKEQGFMAGWLAMRFLNDRAAAKGHFEAAQKAADGPLSRGKAGYWLGRLAEAEADVSRAAQHYAMAAKEIDTFYGQLARLRLDPKNRRIEIKLPEPPSASQATGFNSLDAIKAVVVAKKAGLDPAVARSFLSHLRSHFESQTEIAMVNHLASALGDTQMALRNAKSGVARGQDMLLYAYPVHAFPSFRPLGRIPETAVLLAVTRQETEFNKQTVSGAGAKGLMQVMTITAKHVCKDYKITCEIDRLLPDPAYNAQIAASYIGDRMHEFSGSYVLTLAGYNAGPGRTRGWIREFGDPRDPKVDPIDWIERIPFTETREYVAKVLSNIQIYRSRLGDEDNALQLDIDLNRGRATAGAPPTPGRPPAQKPPTEPAASAPGKQSG